MVYSYGYVENQQMQISEVIQFSQAGSHGFEE